MNTTTSIILTGVIVTAGQWAQSKKVEIRTFIGLSVLALGLAALSEANEEFAKAFGMLIVVAALLYYAIPISRALGYTR